MTPEHETATSELGDLFGCAGATQAEIAWFLFGLGQLAVMSQVNPEQAQMLIQAMHKDVEDLQNRSDDLTDKMEQTLTNFQSATEVAIENRDQEESDENL